MTSDNFVQWFRGFVAAANAYNVTPAQWEKICNQLSTVENVEGSPRATAIFSSGDGKLEFENITVKAEDLGLKVSHDPDWDPSVTRATPQYYTFTNDTFGPKKQQLND